MAATNFKLFPFQEHAAQSLRTAALKWMELAAAEGPPKYGKTTIPFLGQLRAVTGAGKTPILADVVGGLGPAVVLWTSRSSAVVEQTYNNLRGKYASLLPTKTRVLKEIPGQAGWRSLMDSDAGLTIWLLTVASWNEAESAAGAGSAEARLNLHRIHRDWAGETSPWNQLRNELRRPLWIVSDESHNQSATQLDQLADLRPKGFFMASATPVANERFVKWMQVLDEGEDEWRELRKAGVVRVDTRDVVDAELLKTTIELIDFASGSEESLDGALATLKVVTKAAKRERVGVSPRAIYVVEKSNSRRGAATDPPPVTIWKHLVAKGISPSTIAVYTDTRELPEGAERVSSLSGLHDRYRHIIFNQSLQEGWDDPEAYVCYFDGVTKSFTRIKQIVGRILRQPDAQHLSEDALNTATIIINVPAAAYDTVISELKTEMRLYAPDDEPDTPVIKIRTRREPLPPVPVKKKWIGKLSLPNQVLKAPSMKDAIRWIEARGTPWRDEDLEAPGRGRRTIVDLREEKERGEFLDVVRSARTPNGVFLRRQIQARNRNCLIAIHPDAFAGAGYAQLSCLGSTAQQELSVLADRVVAAYEDGVDYQDDPDPDTATWRVAEYRPRSAEMTPFSRAAHPEYAASDLNNDERDFAQALDARKSGVWARNPATANLGFSVPLPAKVQDSSRFYPDFLWWPNGSDVWAIDTTGGHLLNTKVRGKLIAFQRPKLALVVRGGVDLSTGTRTEKDGWTLVRAKQYTAPRAEHFPDLASLLQSLEAG